MDEALLRELLAGVAHGSVGIESALEQLKDLPYQDIGMAKLDTHRQLRRGFPEVIFGGGKTVQQMVTIAQRLASQHDLVLATRVAEDAAARLCEVFPEARHHQEARMVALVKPTAQISEHGDVVVASGGTADIPVAEEAALTAAYMGNKVTRIYDIGVSALQRVLDQRRRLDEARVIIVVAGMDAALAAVITGLVHVPVIAVPTSVGYGTVFGGVAPLLTMLNSCSSGVAVVNIDNGFGAGHLASLINHLP